MVKSWKKIRKPEKAELELESESNQHSEKLRLQQPRLKGLKSGHFLGRGKTEF